MNILNVLIDIECSISKNSDQKCSLNVLIDIECSISKSSDQKRFSVGSMLRRGLSRLEGGLSWPLKAIIYTVSHGGHAKVGSYM